MGNRKMLNFNTNWLFIPEDNPAYMKKNIDESLFEIVSIPHSNKIHPHNYFDEKDYQFVSWYRRHFKIDSSYRGKRIAVEFEGTMTVAEVYLNETKLCEHKGGYTAFIVDLTDHIDWDGDNVIAVRLDSTHRPDIPPEGGIVDYMLFGGIYRNVNLLITDHLYVDWIFASTPNASEKSSELKVIAKVVNNKPGTSKFTLKNILYSGDLQVCELASEELKLGSGESKEIELSGVVKNPRLWDLDDPYLYKLNTLLTGDSEDSIETRIGFRSIRFNEEGIFELNGKKIKLAGHNRHQNFPYVGGAMCDRYQRKDADLIKYELGSNFVRTSHYPQAKSFLDRCDEIGLLVIEELPGWQFIGDDDWKELCYKNIVDMIVRDRNHPSIIMWGVRINESLDDDDFYIKTNKLSHDLDPTRYTTGIRYLRESSFLEDVYGFNDYRLAYKGELRPPNYHPYFVSEYLGVMFPTKSYDNIGRQVEFARRHALTLNALYRTSDMAGACGWCAFDYNTHLQFGHGDRICYHGVMDIFRIPKLAAMVYKSQIDPKKEVVVFIAKYIVPAFFEDHEQLDRGYAGRTFIFSNCEEIELIWEGKSLGRIKGDSENFPYLPHPPFVFDVPYYFQGMSRETKMIAIGYINGKEVGRHERRFSGRATAVKLEADYDTIYADGSDLTRVIVSVVDEHGQHQPFCHLPVSFSISGNGRLIGENPLSMEGGRAAVYVQSTMEPGEVILRATCRDLIPCEIKINTVHSKDVFVP